MVFTTCYLPGTTIGSIKNLVSFPFTLKIPLFCCLNRRPYMNNGLFKKILPHLIAIVIFLVVSVFFCKPALEGNVLNQSDIIGWKGMSNEAFQYKEQNGHFPLWNTHLFSGMPNYQVALEGKTVLPDVTKVMSLWLPKPMNFFFLACICFYILCLAFRLNSVIGILGGLAFAFSTYNPIIVGVGHESKMLAIAA